MIPATKDLGIWMDHANAYLTEFTTDPMTTRSINSAFTHEQKTATMNKSEFTAHNKEQQDHAAYYKQIGEVILNYDRVILFGPTDAKAELKNLLNKDHRFENIRIEVKNADKMTEHEQQVLVRNHFSLK